MNTFQKSVSSMRGTLAKSCQKLDILMFIAGIIHQYSPNQLRQDILMSVLRFIRLFFPYQLRQFLLKHAQKMTGFLDPYIEISISNHSGSSFFRLNSTYTAVESYLTKITSNTTQRLKVETGFGTQKILVKLDEDHETIFDVFQGVTVCWSFSKTAPPPQQRSLYSAYPEPEKKFFKLRFHRKYRELITVSYLGYVVEKGKEAQLGHRKRKLYTNCSSGDSYSLWTSIPFQHPARFESLAMDPEKKKEIVDDIVMFSQSGDYYAQIGKPWKRGYLLYGPPGTGKSTMIVAMANFLGYDVYDLEMTAVKDNIELRKLLIDTKSKAIIVIEDIDCSLDLTGDRKTKTDAADDKATKEVTQKQTAKANKSKVFTLSGLLNFIDGIWSASAGERIIVFTTNHVDKLDPALLRSGRMDKHIELSYCSFAAFKVFARNYLKIETHCLFEKVEKLMKEVKITPADVGENLMPRTPGEDAEKRLSNFVQALEALKKPASPKMEDKEKEGEEDVKESNGEVESAGNIAKHPESTKCSTV